MTSPRPFTIEWHQSAAKELAELPRALSHRIAAKVEQLSDDPYPPGARQLTGFRNLFRIRVGDYRILYRIRGEQLVVLVLHVSHRSRIYTQLGRSRRALDT